MPDDLKKIIWLTHYGQTNYTLSQDPDPKDVGPCFDIDRDVVPPPVVENAGQEARETCAPAVAARHSAQELAPPVAPSCIARVFPAGLKMHRRARRAARRGADMAAAGTGRSGRRCCSLLAIQGHTCRTIARACGSVCAHPSQCCPHASVALHAPAVCVAAGQKSQELGRLPARG